MLTNFALAVQAVKDAGWPYNLVTKLCEPSKVLNHRLRGYGEFAEAKFEELCTQREALIDAHNLKDTASALHTKSERGVRQTEQFHDASNSLRAARELEYCSGSSGGLDTDFCLTPTFKESIQPQSRRRGSDASLSDLAIHQPSHEHRCWGPKDTWCALCYKKYQSKGCGRTKREEPTEEQTE